MALYLCLVISFGLGLLSKPMLVTLPFVLLLLDFWPLGRFRVVAAEGRKDKGRRESRGFSMEGEPLWGLVKEKITMFVILPGSRRSNFSGWSRKNSPPFP
jgi:hypothetical protein